ncbi:hypothetical protein HGA34_04005 [Candidatus Falkowbacteria bacterium]|nr:hypothetical protein [Candidatus Falkowbacteria bacterium]
MEKSIIYLFGNPLLAEDNLPLQLEPALKLAFPRFDFIWQDPNENLRPDNGELIIIDTVVGPEEVIVLTDLEKIERSPNYSLHDLDLGFNLKLLSKIGLLDKVTIFGLPAGGDSVRTFEQLSRKIKEIL